MNSAELEQLSHDFFQRLRYEGSHEPCPCCKRHAQLYKRSITSTMARQLLEAYELGGSWQYIHVKELAKGRSSAGDFTKLKHWNLIKPKEHNEGDDGKKTIGMWMLTPAATHFIAGTTDMPKYLYIFDDRVLQFSEEKVLFRDCLDEPFDYKDLQKRVTLQKGEQGSFAL